VHLPQDELVCLVATEARSGMVRVAVSGDLDYNTAEQFRAGLLVLLERVPVSVLDLDLSAVGFCDCAGLNALLAAFEAATLVGCRFTISAATPGTAWLLERTGLGPHLGYTPEPYPVESRSPRLRPSTTQW
jgi:anti-anti-sigma factor